MTEPLSVNTDGVRSLSDIHSTVAAGLGSVSAAAPGAAAVTTSHGTIASAVDTALTAALGSRSSTMTTTQASGARIAELLHQAALAYERGDQRGAEAIRSAADAIARGETPAGSAGPAGSAAAVGAAGASPAAGGSDAIGQLAGQLSQLGQTGQQLGAPLSALGQPLQQLPQQVMQGVQQIAQTTAQAPGSEAAVAQPAEVSTMAEERQRPDGDTAPDAAGAAPGATSGAGQAPIDLPQAAPVTPTQPATD